MNLFLCLDCHDKACPVKHTAHFGRCDVCCDDTLVAFCDKILTSPANESMLRDLPRPEIRVLRDEHKR